ncbi:MAG TPA: PEP-CTERM sorting domain-containing protein [Verrucomicrobiae bacterium]|jgi:hypothetical protein
MKQQILKIALTIALAIPAISNAQVVMTANDAIGTTSFNAAGTWSPAGAPAAGSTYSTLGFLLRSPTTAGSYTFTGNSLTVGGGNGGGANTFSPVSANNDALIFKVSAITLTVNNLILDGGQIRDGNGVGQAASLDGNITVTANGGSFIAQDTNFINSAISGSGTIYIGDNGQTTDQRARIVFTSGASTFNGNIMMTNTAVNTPNRSILDFAAGSLMNFKIGANGVNNKISGVGTVTFSGSFTFDLSTADNTIGDSWDIVDPSVLSTYNSLTVNGFTQNGTSWDDLTKGVDYDFSQTTGLLTVEAVPEPSILALCGMGLAGLVGWKRRK